MEPSLALRPHPAPSSGSGPSRVHSVPVLAHRALSRAPSRPLTHKPPPSLKTGSGTRPFFCNAGTKSLKATHIASLLALLFFLPLPSCQNGSISPDQVAAAFAQALLEDIAAQAAYHLDTSQASTSACPTLTWPPPRAPTPIPSHRFRHWVYQPRRQCHVRPDHRSSHR